MSPRDRGGIVAGLKTSLLESVLLPIALAAFFLPSPRSSRSGRWAWATITGGIFLSTLAALLTLAAWSGTSAQVAQNLAGLEAPLALVSATESPFICGGTVRRAIQDAAQIRGVSNLSPYVIANVMLLSKNGANEAPALVKGVDFQLERQTTSLSNFVSPGSLGRMATAAANDNVILIGERIAQTIGAAIGDQILVEVPEPTGARSVTAIVAGTFATGTSVDSQFAYSSLEFARDLGGLPPACVTGISVKTTDPYAAAQLGDAIVKRVGSVLRANDWTQRTSGYFQSVALLRLLVRILECTVLVLGILFSSSALLLIVQQKHREAAILASMGMEPYAVRLVFVGVAVALATVGATGAVVLYVPLAWSANSYRILRIGTGKSVVPFISFHLSPAEIAGICALTVFLAACFAWAMLSDVGRINVAEVMRDA